jgi:hypothetical protein
MDEYITWKNTFILAFIILNVFTITYWNLSWDGSKHTLPRIWVLRYADYTGLWQNWRMFSPDPPMDTPEISIKIIGNDTETILEPQNGVNKVRVRKFYENLLSSEYFFSSYLQWWCDKTGAKRVEFLVTKRKLADNSTVEEPKRGKTCHS